MVPALAAAQALINAPPATGARRHDRHDEPRRGTGKRRGRRRRAHRAKEAVPFLEFAIKYGDPQAKEKAAALLYTGAAPLLQQPQDLAGAAELLEMAVERGNPSGKVYPAANYLLGLATLFQVPQVDPQAEKRKSCDLAKQEETLLNDAGDRAHRGPAVNQEAVDKNLGIIKQYKPRVASMKKAYCK